MRVEAYNQIAALYKTGRTGQTRDAQGAAAGRDEVQISPLGRDYQIAKQAVAEAEDIREDKVAQLKARIDSGSYKVSPDAFAAKLLEKYNAVRF